MAGKLKGILSLGGDACVDLAFLQFSETLHRSQSDVDSLFNEYTMHV